MLLNSAPATTLNFARPRCSPSSTGFVRHWYRRQGRRDSLRFRPHSSRPADVPMIALLPMTTPYGTVLVFQPLSLLHRHCACVVV